MDTNFTWNAIYIRVIPRGYLDNTRYVILCLPQLLLHLFIHSIILLHVYNLRVDPVVGTRMRTHTHTHMYACVCVRFLGRHLPVFSLLFVWFCEEKTMSTSDWLLRGG